jgi:GMP synthase-like glutamine amidotransferase
VEPILVLDCYLDDVGGARNVVPHLGPCVVVRAAREPLPMRVEGGGIVVTGSAASVVEPPIWLERLEALLLDAAERGTAILGLCFGHQVLARALFGEDAVRRSPTPELGWTEVRREADDELFAGVSRTFTTFVSHADEVDPSCAAFREEAVVLASSDRCAVQAYRVRARPLWGVQFHAEMPLTESEELVRERAEAHGLDAEGLLAGAVATEDLAARLLGTFRGAVDGL